MRFKKVIEGYGTSYNDLKSGTTKPTDFSKALDNAKEPVKATDKKGSQVDVISTAGEKDVVVQHANKWVFHELVAVTVSRNNNQLRTLFLSLRCNSGN